MTTRDIGIKSSMLSDEISLDVDLCPDSNGHWNVRSKNAFQTHNVCTTLMRISESYSMSK
jgi:hypothetical protein